MPRQPKLRKKSGYWYTDSGGTARYFGRVDEVPHLVAKKLFAAHLTDLASRRPAGGAISAAVLFDEFLEAVRKHRSERTYLERKLHLDRFANFPRGTGLLGDLSATSVHADDLTAFLADAAKKYSIDEFTAHKHMTSIIAAFNWGVGLARLKNPRPSLPANFRPFTQLERYKAPANELLEGELPTQEEVTALLKHADTDIENIYEGARWRSRRDDERRQGKDNPYAGFAALLRLYFHTGARTSELAACSVRDVIHGASQIVLGVHKRSKTLREAGTRRITLNKHAYAIVKQQCQAKDPNDPIFVDPKGRRWTRYRLVNRFAQVRALAGVREEITIYSFRHAWISEALMSGVDIATVAKMAGTSVAMVEKVYGHFSGEHLAEAQSRLDAARTLKVTDAK